MAKGYALSLLTAFISGCSQPERTSTHSDQALRISRSQAEAIAHESTEALASAPFTLGTPKLVNSSFWRVIVTPSAIGLPAQTNLLSSALTPRDAEFVSEEVAASRLGRGNFRVSAAEFVPGPFWIVGVWSVPAGPGHGCSLYISARDGTIVKEEPGM